MADIDVTSDGILRFRGHEYRCALGRAGLVSEKREGDGGTPVGTYPLRRVLYRADRLPAPATALALEAIRSEDGWCDAPADPAYNRQVELPYPASAEALWRRDRLYDLVVVLGQNDSPPMPGLGSAIFLHLARADWGPTEGCVAVTLETLLEILAEAGPETQLRVLGDEAQAE